MKVVFVSNFFNHHQKPFSDAMSKLCGNDYHFIVTGQMSEERKKLGWGIKEVPSYVKTILESQEEKELCFNLIDEADVVIFGGAPKRLIKERLKKHKPVFMYSERIRKVKQQFFKDFVKKIVFPFIYNKKNCYMLCASAYTAADFKHYGCFKNKTYKWGYFPEIITVPNVDECISFKKKNSILWAGRLIDWKHPEVAVNLAKRLKQAGVPFTLDIIGSGYMYDQLEQMIKENELCDYVKLLGSMPPQDVRKHMQESQIFLFTSNKQEGWGAVLNESMNSMCAVVASHAIGSVPFLIKDGENGLVYQDGNEDDVFNKVVKLLNDNELTKSLSLNAYKTITQEWNAEVAARKFLELAQRIINDKKTNMFSEGVCSKAEVLKDNWYR